MKQFFTISMFVCLFINIHAQGKTKKETRDNIKQAIEYLLKQNSQDGYKIKKMQNKNVYIIYFEDGDIEKIEVLSKNFYVIYIHCYRIYMFHEDIVVEGKEPCNEIHMQQTLEQVLEGLVKHPRPDT